MKIKLDSLDEKIVAALSRDGQMSTARISEKLEVTSPTVRSRIKGLIGSGVLKIAGLVDPFRTKGVTVALVGISLVSHKQLDEKLEQLSAIPRVNWAAVVTGRYDIIVEIILSDDMGDLYHFLDQDLSKLGGIGSSESFVVMKAKRKWVCLPEGVRAELD